MSALRLALLSAFLALPAEARDLVARNENSAPMLMCFDLVNAQDALLVTVRCDWTPGWERPIRESGPLPQSYRIKSRACNYSGQFDPPCSPYSDYAIQDGVAPSVINAPFIEPVP